MQTADFVATLSEGRANPGKITVALTMALNALKKGHGTALILLIGAVELGKPGAFEGIDIGAPFRPAAELFAEYSRLGGRVCLCSSCMTHNGFAAADMDPDYEIITGPDVIDLLTAAKGSLQLA